MQLKIEKKSKKVQLKIEKTIENRPGKKLLGWYTQRIRNADINIVNTNRLLKSARLKAETEGLIIAA